MATYQKLLSEIEKSIVEKQSGDTAVQFQKITLDRDNIDGNFKLTIKLQVNHKQHKNVELHFDTSKETVSCDPDISLDSILPEQVDASSEHRALRFN